MPDRPTHLDDVDQWLLSRLYVTEKSVTEAFDAYDNQAAAHALYRFFWSELCDWYIEVAKPRLNDPSQRATPQWVLLTCIEAFLTMMHPFMPHITEEVYSRLPIPSKAPFLMQAKWPELDSGFHQPEVETRVERIFEVTRAFRALRAELGLPAIKAIPVAFYEGDLGGAEIVRTQAWIESLQQGKPAGEKFVSTTVEGVDLHIPLGDLVDPEKEVLRLEREMEKVTADLQKLEARLANPDFVSRAKPEVIERDRSQADDLRTKLEKTRERLRLFSG